MVDRTEKPSGEQSLRLDPAPGKDTATFEVRLGHIPGHDHRLSLWLKAGAKTTARIAVKGLKPANWHCPIADFLRRQQPDSPDIPTSDLQPVTYEAEVAVDSEWREFHLDSPVTAMPVEGYRLVVSPASRVALWLDLIRFKPQWK